MGAPHEDPRPLAAGHMPRRLRLTAYYYFYMHATVGSRQPELHRRSCRVVVVDLVFFFLYLFLCWIRFFFLVSF